MSAREVVEQGPRVILVTDLTEDLTPKVLDILRAVIPKASVIADLFNPANPSNRVMREEISKGSGAGATIRSFEFKPRALDSTFDEVARQRPDALLVISACKSRPSQFTVLQGAEDSSPGPAC